MTKIDFWACGLRLICLFDFLFVVGFLHGLCSVDLRLYSKIGALGD